MTFSELVLRERSGKRKHEKGSRDYQGVPREPRPLDDLVGFRMCLQARLPTALCCILMILGLVFQGCSPSLRYGTTELAGHLGMEAFGPAGGYPLGTLVAMDDENDLPEAVIPRDWLVTQGQMRVTSEPISSLPNMVIDTRTQFQQSLRTGSIAAVPVEAKQALNDVSGFVIHINKARRNWLTMGPMAFIDWVAKLDPSKPKDACILHKIHLARRGRQLHYIYEVVEVQEGHYEVTWNRNLSVSAKAVFEQLMAPVGSVNWTADGRATILIPKGASIMVAYKAHHVPNEALKRAPEYVAYSVEVPGWKPPVNPCIESTDK